MITSRSTRFNLRVFISSTFSDLEEYRQAAFEAIQSLGAHGDDMIFWSADERSGTQLSIDRVRQCDVVVLLLAHRYGYVAEGSTLGVTELEYQTAREADIPVLAFFLDESVPWPPERVEWERIENLKAFKQRVEKETTRKVFRSTDDLGRLVTQAIALFKERHRTELSGSNRYRGVTLIADSSMSLRNQPDAAIQIGTSEDGLPLVLRIKRSHDLSDLFDRLKFELNLDKSAEALVSSFKQALEAHGKASWALERILSVRCRDGIERDQYVSKANLSQIFRSVLSSILDRPSFHDEDTNRSKGRRSYPVSAIVNVPSISAVSTAALKSEGGQNRFLGIDPVGGGISSVGIDEGRWVQWRPFLFESIRHAIPQATYELEVPLTCRGPLSELPKALMEFATENPSDDGRVSAGVTICIPRQRIFLLLAEIARRAGELHEKGLVHGDLKPANIMLGEQGPVLIDAFEMREGTVAPGWTPDWSAPEQVLGELVTVAADVYPIGKMIVDAIGGELVGEVRKFRARPTVDQKAKEFDIFYNPSIYVRPADTADIALSVAAWQALAKRCLAFAPADRPKSGAHVAKLIFETAEKYPMPGEVRMSMPEDLWVVTLLDGRPAVARLIPDGRSPPSPWQVFGTKKKPYVEPRFV